MISEAESPIKRESPYYSLSPGRGLNRTISHVEATRCGDKAKRLPIRMLNEIRPPAWSPNRVATNPG
jgi:hypothetical protein